MFNKQKMKYFLIVLFTFFVLEAACPATFGQSRAHYQLRKACRFLWNQQSADGGWHSKTHGIMRGGASLTAYITHTLLQVPTWLYEPEEIQVEKAVQFIRDQCDEFGVVGCLDPDILDYPNYATAYALMVLKEIDEKKDSSLIRLMRTYLIQQQFTAQRGFTKDQAAYGAWGFGESNLTKGQVGHVDLSHTRRVLSALKESSSFAAAAQKARYFFRLTQKQPNEIRLHATGSLHKNIPYDGGFFASPVTLGTNKAGIATDSLEVANYFRSYATATCDGILGLLASGYNTDNQAVSAAFRWLQKHPSWLYPEGIPLDDPEQWHEVMFFYHLAVRTKVYAKMGVEDNWKKKVIKLLEIRQQSNGSFQNPMGAPNKEDDPLIATAFAIEALCDVIIK